MNRARHGYGHPRVRDNKELNRSVVSVVGDGLVQTHFEMMEMVLARMFER